jgi:hypothetical protein
MPDHQEILELSFEGNGIKPELVKPHEIAELIVSFEKALLFAIKQDNPEVDTESLLFSFDQIGHNSIDLLFRPLRATSKISSGYKRIADGIKTGDYTNLNNGTLAELKTLTRFSKKYGCQGHFVYNRQRMASFNPNTEIQINRNKILKGKISIYGRLIDVGGDNPNIHIRLKDKETLIFKTTEANAKLLAPRIYDKVKLVGEGKWDAETFEVLDFKMQAMDNYVAGNAALAISQVREMSFGTWDKLDLIDDMDNQLLRD